MADKALLNENTRFTVLRLLQANPQMTQRELAQALGVSLGKTNYCLKALLDKGLLKVHNFQSSQRKLAYAYLLTPSGIAEKVGLTGRFLQCKLAEFEALKAEIESLQSEAEKSPPSLRAPESGPIPHTDLEPDPVTASPSTLRQAQDRLSSGQAKLRTG